MTTVLVTGGAGYIGSHIAKALSRAGHLPVVIDDLSGGYRENVRWGPLVVADLNDRPAVDTALREHRPKAVVHCAGRIDAATSFAEPERYLRDNVTATQTLLDAMNDNGVGALVFSSSAAVYGSGGSAAIAEDAPLRPISPYGQSKVAAEAVISLASQRLGLQWLALRYFNAAGADPDGEIGECHEPETHAIPLAIAAARGGPPFRLFGTDHPTPDGTPIRDYVHVADLADCHVRAVEALLAGRPSGIFNLGSERGTSVLELLAAVGRQAGHPVPAVAEKRRPGDAAVLVADSTRARQSLGWQARPGDLERIIASAWTWHSHET